MATQKKTPKTSVNDATISKYTTLAKVMENPSDIHKTFTVVLDVSIISAIGNSMLSQGSSPIKNLHALPVKTIQLHNNMHTSNDASMPQGAIYLLGIFLLLFFIYLRISQNNSRK